MTAIWLVFGWAASSPDAGFAAAGRQKMSFFATLSASLLPWLLAACGADPVPATAAADTVADAGAETTGDASPVDGSPDAPDATQEITEDTFAADTGVADVAPVKDVGPPAVCAALPDGPFQPALVSAAFSGSEDLAFDGKGGLYAKKGSTIQRLAADGSVSTWAEGIGAAYGLRFLPDGHLAVALYQASTVALVAPDGAVSELAKGLSSPNGIYADLDGNVFVTEFGKGQVVRIAPDKQKTVVVTGAKAPNGVVLDPARSLLFYTHYSEGKILKIQVDTAGNVGEGATVGQIPGAALDGLALDACGHLYAVDQKGSKVYRLRLDATGTAIGEPALLATFPKNVANIQFGSGEGWQADALYAAGMPGSVFKIAVGVPGAAVPVAP